MKDSIIAGLASVFTSLGFIGFLFRWQRNDIKTVDEKVDKNSMALCSLDDKFITEKEHSQICETASLRLEMSFDKHFATLKDEVFTSQRSLKDDIVNLIQPINDSVKSLEGSVKSLENNINSKKV